MGKIIYAAPADLGSFAAHNVHIVRMCEALTQEGEEVTLAVKDGPQWASLAADYALADEFDVRRLPAGRGPLASLGFAFAVLRLSRAGDLVLTRNLPAALVAALFGRPTILELHSPVGHPRSRLMLRVLSSAPRFLGLVVITKALRQHFEAALGPGAEGRIFVIADAATAAPNPRARARALPSPSVGYVGSFLPGKGVDLALRIAEALPKFNFYLVGGSAPDAGIAEADAPRNVRFVGRVAHREAADWIDAFDMVLLPNQATVLVSGGTVDIGAWTSPLKLFEYMAAAKPIVASRLPVLQEVLEDGRNCLLADPDDPADWVDRLRRLAANAEMAEGLGRQAREDLVRDYTWRARARRMIAIANRRTTQDRGGAA